MGRSPAPSPSQSPSPPSSPTARRDRSPAPSPSPSPPPAVGAETGTGSSTAIPAAFFESIFNATKQEWGAGGVPALTSDGEDESDDGEEGEKDEEVEGPATAAIVGERGVCGVAFLVSDFGREDRGCKWGNDEEGVCVLVGEGKE
ncbi:hypothetical protein HK104_001021 [Borealophlyctis nickersoniae]|nr:hypothetical protein HK104_001021 [Borealophlyctis nickersoniae]